MINFFVLRKVNSEDAIKDLEDSKLSTESSAFSLKFSTEKRVIKISGHEAIDYNYILLFS